MGRTRASEKKVIAALKAAMGNVSLAARNLGADRSSLYERINKSPTLQQVLRDAREAMVDNAESALGRAVLSGEAWAVCFCLKTQGKSRGYIERHEINATETVRREIVEEIVDVTITHQQQQPATGSDPAALGATSVRSLPSPV